jgi:hypothetical protein
LQDLMRTLYSESKSTFVIVTHDVREALTMADRIIVLGPAPTGVVYDSGNSGRLADESTLTALLDQFRVTIGGGTWNGYAPLRRAVQKSGRNFIDFTFGLSDRERAAALNRGALDAAFFTIQGLAAILSGLKDCDPAIVYMLSRPDSPVACERIVARRASQRPWRWAIPDVGFEATLIRRLDPAFSMERLTTFSSRAACVSAVLNGQADACIADPQLVSHLAPWHKRLHVRYHYLPQSLCSEMATVLVVPQRVIQNRRHPLQHAIQHIGALIQSRDVSWPHIAYITPNDNRYLLPTDVQHLCDTYCDSAIRIDTSLIAESDIS